MLSLGKKNMALFSWSRLLLASFCIMYGKMSCEKVERQYRRRISLTRTLSSREEYAGKNEVQMFRYEETY